MSEIKIRKAEQSDFDFFYLIKCDEDNINWCGHTLPPLRENLSTFFSLQIKNQNESNKRTIYIVEEILSKTKVGYLYFDPIDKDFAEVSIGILQKFSGNGFGRKAVMKLCSLAYKCGFKEIDAMVREDNLKSQRMFKHAGFKETNSYKFEFIPNQNKEIKMIRFENSLK